ncbi:hypothetical protein NDU88_005796 [Pleurodeles waltl]|uniref:Uncharacterized protein n=1 Tax=Pleurodeles waltl TaxID=8319 RepID=A0AAV7TDN9_PLEWA|nr:hypothetical protein NDU88_005796 [Pleurodeles waltl]
MWRHLGPSADLRDALSGERKRSGVGGLARGEAIRGIALGPGGWRMSGGAGAAVRSRALGWRRQQVTIGPVGTERGPAELLWPPPPILLVNRHTREAVPVRIGEYQGSHRLAARPDRGERCGWLAEEDEEGHWAFCCPRGGPCDKALGDCKKQLIPCGETGLDTNGQLLSGQHLGGYSNFGGGVNPSQK